MPSKEAVATLVQDDGQLTVKASHICDVVEERKALRTTTTESNNRSAETDWALGALGIASVVTGTILVVDSKNVYPRDDTSRTYNLVGPEPARNMGYGLVGAGAVLGTIAIVDVIRANHTTVDTQEVILAAKAVQQGVPCRNAPYAGLVVEAKHTHTQFSLGKTGRDGTLSVDLDDQVPPDLTFYSRNLTAEVLLVVNGKQQSIGQVDITQVYRARESRAWRQASPECESPTTPSSCKAVEDFLGRFPDGPNAVRAKGLLARMKLRLENLSDEQVWWAIKPDDCSNKEANETIADIEFKCRPLRDYLERFPEGNHAQEARRALGMGESRIAAQESQVRGRAAAEEATRQEAGRKSQAAQECRAKCRSGCGSNASCFGACVAAKCR